MKLSLPKKSLLISLFVIFLPISAGANDRIAPPLDVIIKKAGKLKGDAVLLRQHREIKLDKDGNSHKTLYRAIKLNTRDAARDFSQISIGFNSHFKTAKLDFARVITSDGKVLELDKDAVQIQNNAQADFYQDGRNLVFSLPAVAEGAVIEYQVYFEPLRQVFPGELTGGNSFYAPSDSLSEKGFRVDSVGESIVSISVPTDKRLKYRGVTGEVKYFKSSQNGFTEHKWVYKKLPEIIIERAMPDLSEITPFIEYTTVNSWSDIDAWSYDLMNEKLRADREIKKIAKQINKKHTSEQAKIQAVYEYVQKNIRYVFAHVDRGGYEPHFASKVLASQYGDCKDQTILTVSLLNELGIEAYPALISTNQSMNASDDVPSLPFDHMITYVPHVDQAKGMWIDTTGEQSLFPGYSAMIEGRKALVIDGKGGKLLSTPVLDATENSVTVDVVFSELNDGYPRGSITFNYKGLYEDNYRSWWINTDDKKTNLSEILKQLYPDLKLVAFEATSPLDLSTPFSVKTDFTIEKDWSEKSEITYAATVVQLLTLYSGLMQLPLPSDRVNDFVIPKGVNLTLNVRILPPVKGAKPVLVNPGLNSKNKWFDLKQEGKNIGDEYLINISFKIPEARLNPKEFSDFYRYVERLKKNKSWLVFYDKTDSIADENKGRKELAKDYSLSKKGNVLAEIQKALDEGEYDSALSKAKAYVERNPKSGEGFYLLGLAQGYLDKFNASDRSFAKAKSLGYKF